MTIIINNKKYLINKYIIFLIIINLLGTTKIKLIKD